MEKECMVCSAKDGTIYKTGNDYICESCLDKESEQESEQEPEKEQREFFKASIELCDRCGDVKDVSQFAGIIETTKGEKFAICKACKKERIVQILTRAGNATGLKFIERKEV